MTTDLIAHLRTTVHGSVVTPDDPSWDQERLAWHLLVPQQPAAIVHVDGVEDIQAAVRAAGAFGVKVAAQPRGHGATADTATGTILLRFDRLRGIERRDDVVRVEPGVQWRELNAVLEGTGYTALPGSNGDTSVIGYSVGGGLSWFSRKYGQAAHQIRAIDLVDAEGNHRTVTADSDPDLFWAVRGGGGEFGIVTALELQLQAEEQVYGGRLIWPAEHGRELLRAFAAVSDDAPEELSVWAWLMNLPDVDLVPEPMRGRWWIAIDVAFLGDGDDAEKLLAPLYDVAAPAFGELAVVPLGQVGSIAQEPEDPMPAMGRIRLLNEFGGEAIDTLLDLMLDGPTPIAMIEVRRLGGAFARPRPGDGAAGVIEEPYLLLAGALAMAPGDADEIENAFHNLHTGMGRFLSDRVPPNLATVEPIEQLYPVETLERLRAIKRQVDPQDVIRGNHPVL
ncbi:FAD-binding oxidoreductase [Kribbella sp. NPDC051770]|uniref:FAD-binding oxidoreductase n=1 Tax=Kribbella sp. NPDC051770 TaxID=3155413 RepID=UPI00342BBB63